MKKKFIVGITGASGAAYAQALIREFVKRDFDVDLLITEAGEEIIRCELGVVLAGKGVDEKMKALFGEKIKRTGIGDLCAPMASGTYRSDGMVVIPCSMATLGSIANGLSSNLLERAADVTLKEKRRLLLVPRETPLNLIHLNNMARLARAGADIVPAMPGFYHCPKEMKDLIDFVVGKVLDLLGIDHEFYKRWGEGKQLKSKK